MTRGHASRPPRLAGVLVTIVTFTTSCGLGGDSIVAGAEADAPTTLSDVSAPGIAANATVTSVIDGDTIHVDIDGVEESIRFIGIDTPEKTGGFLDAECYGDEANERMRQLLKPGDGVYLELDQETRDRFDRVLAYVYRADDSLFLNMLMVEEGLAVAFPFEPNTLFAGDFERAERRSRNLDLGLWSACGGPDVPLLSGR